MTLILHSRRNILAFAAAAVLTATGYMPIAKVRAAVHSVSASETTSPAAGPSVEVDPTFPYYQNRSVESIAAEIAAHGYRVVRYVVTTDSQIRRDLISAFHRHGLQVWYTTFINGTYSRKDLPPKWQQWKMVTRSDLAGHPVSFGFDYLCLNNPGYRSWKKKQMVMVLHRFPFDGIDLAEPFWPDYPGPDSPTYACFCDDCRKAFAKEYPGAQAPDILNPNSATSRQKNPALWLEWLAFRRDSLANDLNDLVNGPGGIRQLCPKVKVTLWSLALQGPDGIQQVRDDDGEDAVQLARTIRPDSLCLETDWPDWSRPDLPADYVMGYKPFLDAVRRAHLPLPVSVQADVGSQRTDRRSNAWVARFESVCRKIGFAPPAFYEYSIGETMYTDPPAVLAAVTSPGAITLVFSKRVDPEVASNPAHYSVSEGKITGIVVDGASVTLRLSGLRPGEGYRLQVSAMRDIPSLRIFAGASATVSSAQTLDLRMAE